MKADKKTVEAIRNYFETQGGYSEGWMKELINDTAFKTNLLTSEGCNIFTSPDECMVYWTEEEVCVLQEFLEEYTSVLLDKVCKFIGSLEHDEDISYWLPEEQDAWPKGGGSDG